MKTISMRVIHIGMLFVLMFTQFESVAALQGSAQPPAASAGQLPAARELAGKPTTKVPVPAQKPADVNPVEAAKPSLRLSATRDLSPGMAR